MRAVPPILCAALLLSSCTSPPKPPTVEESRKRPANTVAAVELQTCKGELNNSRLLVNQTMRLADSANAAATRLALQREARQSSPDLELANTVYTVPFGFGSAEVKVPAMDRQALLEHAIAAPLVMLRARTDGQMEAPAESRIARDRALAVRAYLIQSGVDATRIRMTWQPVGDTVSDNATPSGRAMNRRVEIELYRIAPRHLSANASRAP